MGITRPTVRLTLRVLRFAALSAASAMLSTPARAQEPHPPCASDPAFGWLDFWTGTWEVYVQGTRVGENRIQKILDGCAITEEWTDASGRRGFSLFYFLPATQTWRQVWVTERALGRGGVKEKELIARLPDGGLRFQGEIRLAGGGGYLDRTTLTPVAPDHVRQRIEISTDGGENWRTMFDALYIPSTRAANAPAADLPSTTLPGTDSAVALRITGQVSAPLAITRRALAALPHQEIRAGLHDRSALYRGVPIADLLRRAGVPAGAQIRGRALRLFVVVRAADGYAAVFALAELDAGFTDRVVLLADARDGEPLPAEEGPLRIVVPGEARGARWVRQVTELEVLAAP